MGVLDFIGNIFKPASDLIDDLHTSDEEELNIQKQKLEIQKQMQEIEAAVKHRMLDYEHKIAEFQAKAIQAEASSSSFLASNWRPITMLTFVALIVARWLGFTIDSLTPEIEEQLFEIIKFGLGGYVIGRSAEKVVSSYTRNRPQQNQTDAAVG